MRNRIVGTLSIVIIVTNLGARARVCERTRLGSGGGGRRKLIINSTVFSLCLPFYTVGRREVCASKFVCYLFIFFFYSSFFRARITLCLFKLLKTFIRIIYTQQTNTYVLLFHPPTHGTVVVCTAGELAERTLWGTILIVVQTLTRRSNVNVFFAATGPITTLQ